jgi:hypothetical protein
MRHACEIALLVCVSFFFLSQMCELELPACSCPSARMCLHGNGRVECSLARAPGVGRLAFIPGIMLGGREGRAAGARGHRERQVGLSPLQSTRRFSPLPLRRTAAFTSVEELDRLRLYRGAYPSDGASLRVCPLPVRPLVTWSTCFPHCRRAAEFFVSMRKERRTSLQQRARRAASARSGFLFGANSAHPLYIAWPACRGGLVAVSRWTGVLEMYFAEIHHKVRVQVQVRLLRPCGASEGAVSRCRTLARLEYLDDHELLRLLVGLLADAHAIVPRHQLEARAQLMSR